MAIYWGLKGYIFAAAMGFMAFAEGAVASDDQGNLDTSITATFSSNTDLEDVSDVPVSEEEVEENAPVEEVLATEEEPAPEEGAQESADDALEDDKPAEIGAVPSYDEIKFLAPRLLLSDDPAAIYLAMGRLLQSDALGLSDEEKDSLSAFYQSRNGELFFIADGEALAPIAFAIEHAEYQGLPKSRYQFPQISGDEDRVAMLAYEEISFAAQLIRYARDMERGIVSPRSVSSEMDFYPEGRERLKIIEDYAAAEDKIAFMRALEPLDPAYPVLKNALAKLRSLRVKDLEGVAQVPEGNVLRPGDYGLAISLLRQRLAALGFMAEYGSVSAEVVLGDDEVIRAIAADQADPKRYDVELEAAVKTFQEVASLSADGIVGPATLSVLNNGPKGNINSILVGLERHRWGPQNRNGRQIYVNIANFMAELRDNNVKTFETIVVVGKAKKDFRTPEFQDKMTHLIVNPKWNVPESISVKEYLPKIQRDPGVLARNNIVMRIKGSGQIVDPRRIDMSQFHVDDFPFLLQQQEGDANALGNVKFMFPNKHNIYLHDTPAKKFFSRASRAYSHGCVRVRDPEDLATVLLAPQLENPRASYRNYLANGHERRIDLASPIPIFITYHTAYLNNNGGLSFAADIYGRDQALMKKLAEKGVVF